MEENEFQSIRAIMIIEMIGKPQEFLAKELDDHISKIEKENNSKILNKKIREPIELENQAGFFSTFAEVEIETDSIVDLINIMFKYMPANIEIVSPKEISLSSHNWGDVLSELIRRLHSYDELVRILQNEKIIIEKKLKELTKKE